MVSRDLAIALGAATLGMTLGCAAAVAAEAHCAPQFWVERTLESVVKYQQNPLRAARNLAYVAVALDSAGSRAGSSTPTIEAAQQLAAGAILDHLYPYDVPGSHRAVARVSYPTTHCRSPSLTIAEGAPSATPTMAF